MSAQRTPLFTEAELRARLEDADDEVRLWAAARLAESGSEAALRALVQSADARAAELGLQTVARKARRELLGAVLERYRASEGEVADACAQVLALFGEEAWLEDFRARGRPASQAAAVAVLGTDAAAGELEALLGTSPAEAMAGLLRCGRGEPAARRIVEEAGSARRRAEAGGRSIGEEAARAASPGVAARAGIESAAETPGLDAAMELLGRQATLRDLAREVPVRPGRALDRAAQVAAMAEPELAGRLLQLRRRGLQALAGALAARREAVLALPPPFREGVGALAVLAAESVVQADSAATPPPAEDGPGRLKWLLALAPRDPMLSAEVERALAAADPAPVLRGEPEVLLKALPRPEAARLCVAWGIGAALDRLLETATLETLPAAASLPGAVPRLAALASLPGEARRAAVEALGFAGAREAASALAASFGALWREERRALHRAAMRLGARELLEPLQGVLHHGEPGDEHVYAFLCAVHGVSDPAAARARDRLLRRAAGELFELELKCAACGASHAYEVAEAVVDPEETEPFVPQPIACKSCGAKDRYAFTDAALESIAAEVERAQTREAAVIPGGAAAPGDDRPLRVRFVRLRALGLAPDPRAALGRFEQELAARPKDVAAMLGRAAALDLLGRAREAREGWLAAQAADPLAVEALLALARDAVRRGDAPAQEAFGYALACCQRMKGGHFHHVRDKTAFRAEALALLALAAQRAGVDLDALAELPPPEAAAGPAAAPKEPARAAALPGRNDPCPCGSGRKFKHCHGR